MRSLPSTGMMMLTAAILAVPALAQTVAQSGGANGAPPNAPASQSAPAQGTLGVASVKLENGWRASKLIGATVYNEQDDKVGTVDDLILTNDDKVVVAVVSVGGFLGIGSKLVAVPYTQFHFGQDRKVILPGGSKDALNALPSFTYGT